LSLCAQASKFFGANSLRICTFTNIFLFPVTYEKWAIGSIFDEKPILTSNGSRSSKSCVTQPMKSFRQKSFQPFHFRRFDVSKQNMMKKSELCLHMWPEVNPTIASYNASVVIFFNATGSLACFEKNVLVHFVKRSSLLQRCKFKSRRIGSSFIWKNIYNEKKIRWTMYF
jgi:hypothetical protein